MLDLSDRAPSPQLSRSCFSNAPRSITIPVLGEPVALDTPDVYSADRNLLAGGRYREKSPTMGSAPCTSVLTLGELREAVEAKRRGVGRSFLRHAGFAQASEKRATRTALRGTVFSFAGEDDVTLRNPVRIGNVCLGQIVELADSSNSVPGLSTPIRKLCLPPLCRRIPTKDTKS